MTHQSKRERRQAYVRTSEVPYRDDHEASIRAARPQPQTFRALSAWFRECWEGSLPARLHTSGVEDGDAWGSPRWQSGFRRRVGNASDRGWSLTGWDRYGKPIGVDDEGYTLDPFLYHLERVMGQRVRDADGNWTDKLTTDALGALALVRWAYLGWDVEATAISTFRRTGDDYAAPAMEALLERSLRGLWWRCQREPVRWSRCPVCKRRECVCAEKSEAQVSAESAA